MTPTFWNEERVEILKRGRAENWPASRTAALLGCTRNAVLGKAHRLGLPPLIHSVDRPVTAGARRPKQALASHRSEKRTMRGPTRPPIDLQAMPFEPVSRKLSIVELDAASCRWISGGDGSCCGHPAARMLRNGQEVASPFCAFHSARAYRPMRERSNSAAPDPRHSSSKTRVNALAASLLSAARRRA